MMKINKWLLLILLADGLLWLRSGFGKISDDKFASGLVGTLGKFASGNPYPPVKDFLQHTAIPNAGTFAFLTQWGEFLSAVVLILSVIYILVSRKENSLLSWAMVLSLTVLAFLSATFGLAAGWMSSSTESLNILMLVVEVVGILAVLGSITKR